VEKRNWQPIIYSVTIMSSIPFIKRISADSWLTHLRIKLTFLQQTCSTIGRHSQNIGSTVARKSRRLRDRI